MGSWYLVRADLRRRWASASLLGLLIGLAGALVVTGVSGARRGPVAFDEFLDTFGPADFSAFPVDPGDLDDLEQAVAASPGVEAWSTRSFVVLGVVDDHGRTDGALGGALPFDGGTGVEWPRFLVGGAPVGPFEFAVNEAVAERLSLAPGDEVSVAVYGADQVDQVGTERQVVPAHGVETFTVTGIGRGPSDLQFQVSGQAGTVYEREGENVLWSPALWDRFGGDLANYGAGVLGRVGPGGDARAIAESLSVADGPFEDRVFTEVGTDAIAVAPIRRVIELQSTALLVATGVLAVVASALALQALSRQLAGLGLGDPVLGALGFDRRSAGMAAGIWGLVVALIAVPVLVGGALIGSLAMPVGVASRADFSEGVMIDVRIVAVALALIVSVLVTGAVLQGRGRLRRRPPRRVQGSPLLQTVVRERPAGARRRRGAERGHESGGRPCAEPDGAAEPECGDCRDRCCGRLRCQPGPTHHRPRRVRVVLGRDGGQLQHRGLHRRGS